jgi:hypothetical protein
MGERNRRTGEALPSAERNSWQHEDYTRQHVHENSCTLEQQKSYAH